MPTSKFQMNAKWFKRKHRLWTPVVGIVLFIPLVTYAAPLLPDCNPVPGGMNPCGLEDIFQLLVNIYNFLLGMAAIVLLLMLVWSGIQMLIAQYDEQPTSAMENAKLSLRRAMFGFVIIAVAYILVNTLLVVLGVANPGDFFSGVKFKPK